MPISGISGLSVRRASSTAPSSERSQPEAAPLVEADRVEIVVRRRQPHRCAACRACRLDRRVEEVRSDPRALGSAAMATISQLPSSIRYATCPTMLPDSDGGEAGVLDRADDFVVGDDGIGVPDRYEELPAARPGRPRPRQRASTASPQSLRQAHLPGDVLERLDPLPDRRMGVPQRLRALLEALDRVDDVQVLGGAVRHLEHLGVVADRAQRARQAERVARQLDRASTSARRLAAAADGGLHQAADERRDHRQHQGQRRR